MKLSKAKSVRVMAVLSIMALFLGSASAVSADDVSVAVNTPEDGENVTAGGLLGGDVYYEIEYSNTGPNSTVADATLTFSEVNSSETFTYDVGNVTVPAGETVTESFYYTPDGYTLSSNFTEVSATFDTTWTDESDGSTVTTTTERLFNLAKDTLFSDIIPWVLVVAVIGAVAREF